MSTWGLWSVVRLKSRESDQIGAGAAAIGSLESTSCGKPVVLSRGVTQSDVLVGLEKEGPWGQSGSLLCLRDVVDVSGGGPLRRSAF